MPIPRGGEVLLLLGSSGPCDISTHTLLDDDADGIIGQTTGCHYGSGLGSGLGMVALQLRPGVGLDVVLVKIVLSIHPIVPSEDVDVVLKCYTCMKGPLQKLNGIGSLPGREWVRASGARTSTSFPGISL